MYINVKHKKIKENFAITKMMKEKNVLCSKNEKEILNKSEILWAKMINLIL